jgi:hypothetical protein
MALKFEELQEIYRQNFSLKYLDTDFTTKAALVGLIDYLVEQLKAKKPDITYYQVIRKLSDVSIPEEFIKGLAIVCEDWAYGCREFPNFGLETKDIPNKIKEILKSYIPF